MMFVLITTPAAHLHLHTHYTDEAWTTHT